MILPRSFYLEEDVVAIARNLLGKFLCTKIDGVLTLGMISETEAYAGVTDRASHAYGGRRTSRTEIMYRRGGTAYVYLCYGIHSLFNVVTNREGIPHAVLIRGIRPAEGIETMKARSGKRKLALKDGSGPGKVSALLGIHYSMSGHDLVHSVPAGATTGIWIEDRGVSIRPEQIEISARIGVDYAGGDAALPYRFSLK